jgi:hypothetical protein
MQEKINEKIFPRELTDSEKYCLFSILPVGKPGYNSYRKKIESLYVIGFGRQGGSNLILGKLDQQPDIDLPSTPVFASGTLILKEGMIDICINEEIDDQIEIDINLRHGGTLPTEINDIGNHNFSEWNPRDNSPIDDSTVRQIKIEEGKYVLAISKLQKKIWLHDFNSGVNHLIPVSNLFNYMLMVRNIRDKNIAINPNLLFEQLDEFTDRDFLSAFLMYNKYFRKVKLDYQIPAESQKQQKKKNIFQKIFRG